MKKILLLIVLVTTTVGIGGFYKVYADTKKDFSTERVKGVDSYALVFVTNQKIAFMNETGEYVSYKGHIYEALVDFTNFGDGNWSPDIAQSLGGFVQ